jgi:NADH-quinone oxidoreductase subunit K/NAD(P)H-quinone oxidoreductase subunit 4L
MVGAILFAIGLYTIVAQRSAVMVLMGIELQLNAVGLNIVAFWRFVRPDDYSAQVFTIIIITIGAVEMAIGLGIVMLIYRQRRTVQVDKFTELKG